MNKSNQKLVRFQADEVYRFVKDVFLNIGVVIQVAELTAKGLWSTSLRGVDSHGIRLLPHYVAGVEGGRINPNPKFHFQRTSASTGWLDADHTFGHAAGIVAMRYAIVIAKEAGAGYVSVKNSSHCGSLAYYALEACKEDMIGFAYTHASSKIRTPNSNRPFFGTNPLCFAAPMLSEGPFCYDTAPTPITFNKVKQHREDGTPLPLNSAADKNGDETLDPNLAEQLLPIGDYKGFGLAIMVDILCGLMSGMPVGQNISNMYKDPLSQKRYLGQFYGALRIDVFEKPERFKQRLQKLAEQVRQEPCVDQSIPVQIPGDPEKANETDRCKNGISIKPLDLDRFNQLANRLGIRPLGMALPNLRRKL